MVSIKKNYIENVDENEQQKKREKLPFGHYKVNHTKVSNQIGISYNVEGIEKVICKPLTQDDYANEWKAIIPRSGKNNNQPIHHWSVTCAQLPPHLWNKYILNIRKYDNKVTSVINDGIYHYTVTPTENDEILIALYYELQRELSADKNKIQEYINNLNGVNSWLIIRANKILKNVIENKTL